MGEKRRVAVKGADEKNRVERLVVIWEFDVDFFSDPDNAEMLCIDQRVRALAMVGYEVVLTPAECQLLLVARKK